MVRGIRWMRERLLTGGEAARQESRWVWDRGSSGLRAGIKKCCGLNRTTALSIFFSRNLVLRSPAGGILKERAPSVLLLLLLLLLLVYSLSYLSFLQKRGKAVKRDSIKSNP